MFVAMDESHVIGKPGELGWVFESTLLHVKKTLKKPSPWYVADVGMVCLLPATDDQRNANNAPTNSFQTLPTTKQDLKSRAQRIYDTFMSDDSTTEINIESSIKRQVRDKLAQGREDKINYSTLFKDAQSMVYKSMQNDTFDRFANSPAYRDFVKKHQELQGVKLV